MYEYSFGSIEEFLSTPSARRATTVARENHLHSLYFYPRPPRGGRPVSALPVLYGQRDFYPRPPRGGRQSSNGLNSCQNYFYPRPPRGGRRRGIFCLSDGVVISIHALREEGDCPWAFTTRLSVNFYPRPPRGGRPNTLTIGAEAWLFLSTPSARRATCCRWGSSPGCVYFYPRPPRGGRPFLGLCRRPRRSNFYPRPPRGGRQQKQRQNLYFQTNYTTFCTNLEEP